MLEATEQDEVLVARVLVPSCKCFGGIHSLRTFNILSFCVYEQENREWGVYGYGRLGLLVVVFCSPFGYLLVQEL